MSKITKIRKRDERIVEFEQERITNAIWSAMRAVGIPDKKRNKDKAQRLSDEVVKMINKKFHPRSIPAVEEIQDIVEEVLIKNRQIQTAKAYILYRDQHAKIREMTALIDSDELIEGYLRELDWRVKENSNMAYSLQGLNNHVASSVSSHYWLNKIYPQAIKEAYLNGDFHIHDLQLLSAYCTGWDLKDLLGQGFGGVVGKVESKPPKHFHVALGQIVNFFYTVQGEIAGAVAFSNFDTYLSPFIKYDKLNYKEVKQAMQEFLFNMNVPTRVGFQTPFSNVTLDVRPSGMVAEDKVIIGGKAQDKKYKDFQKEMDMFNLAFGEMMLEGDAKGRVFTFPIPTYNITKDVDWTSPVTDKIFEMTAKYGVPYFANFVNSDMHPDDARSMCCRLRLDNRELRKRGGGFFGANPLTGSIGVVTINMSRIGYLSKNKEEFYQRLEKIMELAKQSLEIKSEVLEKLTEQGLYPYSRHYLASVKKQFGQYWKNHFNTIGINGMNEALLNFMGKDIAHPQALAFAQEVLDFMREKLMDYQNETNNLFNLEATPAEGVTYRLALKDKELYPEIIVANEKAYKEKKAAPYYTNSTHLPVNYTDDMFEALKLQDELQTRYTGGTVLHGFLGERMPSIEATKKLVKTIASQFHLPYYTLTPTFSVCPNHGYLAGEHWFCPRCDEEIGYSELTN